MIKAVDTHSDGVDMKLHKELELIKNTVQNDYISKERMLGNYGIHQIDTETPDDIQVPENIEELEELQQKKEEYLMRKMDIDKK